MIKCTLHCDTQKYALLLCTYYYCRMNTVFTCILRSHGPNRRRSVCIALLHIPQGGYWKVFVRRRACGVDWAQLRRESVTTKRIRLDSEEILQRKQEQLHGWRTQNSQTTTGVQLNSKIFIVIIIMNKYLCFCFCGHCQENVHCDRGL